MTRTAIHKTIYIVGRTAVSALLAAAGLAAISGHIGLALAGCALFATLLLPGRVLAYFWSDLLAGLHLLNQRDYQNSKMHSERFLAQLLERPWLKKLIWLGTSSYSRNAEVMALNNLGAAELALGETEAAKAHFCRAIDLDPQCPLPYKNMGALTLRTGSYADALPWFEKAAGLGLKGDWTDRMAAAAQKRNAARSTPGSVVSEPRPVPPPDRRPTGAFVVEILNDDTTPFNFVITGLEQVFGLTGAEAIRIARATDREGRAVCAAFETEEMARDKADQLSALARAGGFPLACVISPRA